MTRWRTTNDLLVAKKKKIRLLIQQHSLYTNFKKILSLTGSGSPEEEAIRNIFRDEGEFLWKGKKYKVVTCAKPKSKEGEPKNDIFVEGYNKSSNEYAIIKISYKKENWMPVENKVTRERLPYIYGEKWKTIAKNQNKKLEDKFKSSPIIWFQKKHPTEKGSITLGWRYEIGYESAKKKPKKDGTPRLRRLGIRIEENIHDQVYWGKDCRKDYRDCKVDGKEIEGSGIPDYVLVRNVFIKKKKKIIGYKTKTCKDITDNLKPIKEFSKKHKELDVTYRAQNYRMHLKKKCNECSMEYRKKNSCPNCGSKRFSVKGKTNKPFTPIQGPDRDLPVYTEWDVIDGKLRGKVIIDKPFTKLAEDVLENLMECLQKIGVPDDEDFDISLLKDKLTEDTVTF